VQGRHRPFRRKGRQRALEHRLFLRLPRQAGRHVDRQHRCARRQISGQHDAVQAAGAEHGDRRAVYSGGVFYRHFVFDLDGTLIDSRQDLADAANAMLATYGAAPLPVTDVVAMVGEGARMLVARALARAAVDAHPDAALPHFLAAYDQRLTNTTTLYPGVAATLAQLHGRGRVSVLTNKPQQPTEAILDALGVASLVDAAIGGDTSHGRKPAPAALRALIAQSGVPAAETLMVGDSWVDVATATAAGVDACLAAYGFGYPAVDAAHRSQARWTIATVEELTRLA
jgi:phosphoglycolate phosphatase